jgi:hypothetical protein
MLPGFLLLFVGLLKSAETWSFSKVIMEKENGLVATGILPVIPNRRDRQAGSLSHQSKLGADTHCV